MPSFASRLRGTIFSGAAVTAAASLCLTGPALAKPVKATSASAKPKVTTTTTTTTLSPLGQLLHNDMSLSSEALPHGATYDWAFKPRLSMGLKPGTWQAATMWGQLYECSTGNPQPAARVELRNVELWIQSKATKAWTRVQGSTAPGGGAYVESYVNNVNKAASIVALSDGGISVTAGGGYNFHFWPQGGRVTINPTDIAGVVTTVRARLAPGTFSTSGAAPCYTLSAGGDYWQYLTSSWDNLNTNSDIGIGRFKKVDANWRLYTMSALSDPSGALPAPTMDSSAELR